MMNVLEAVSVLILGSGVTRSMLPAELPADAAAVQADEANLPAYLAALTAAQQKGHVLAATCDGKVAALCRSLNLNFQENKLAIWENGNLDTAELTEELTSQLLHTSDGTEYFPQAMQHPVLFSAGSRVLCRETNPAPDAAVLYTHEDAAWGILLPEAFHADAYCGVLSELHSKFTQAECEALSESSTLCAAPDSTLVFRGKSGYAAFPLPSAKQWDAAALRLWLLTGLHEDADPAKLLAALSQLSNTQTAVCLAERFCRSAVFA